MKSIVRYQSQLLFRRSYKPRRAIRIRPIGKLNHRVPSRETVWLETAINHRLVAQKQSARLITGRTRSVTCRDDQPSLAELRLGEPFPRVAEAD